MVVEAWRYFFGKVEEGVGVSSIVEFVVAEKVMVCFGEQIYVD